MMGQSAGRLVSRAFGVRYASDSGEKADLAQAEMSQKLIFSTIEERVGFAPIAMLSLKRLAHPPSRQIA